MKQTNHKMVMIMDFVCAGIWALLVGFNLAAGKLLMAVISMALFTIFVAFGLFNRQKIK